MRRRRGEDSDTGTWKRLGYGHTRGRLGYGHCSRLLSSPCSAWRSQTRYRHWPGSTFRRSCLQCPRGLGACRVSASDAHAPPRSAGSTQRGTSHLSGADQPSNWEREQSLSASSSTSSAELKVCGVDPARARPPTRMLGGLQGCGARGVVAPAGSQATAAAAPDCGSAG